jgi:3-hydroxymyristoyl/3-hydroxydecanoyl-(acyl carrier protein) dehydratase
VTAQVAFNLEHDSSTGHWRTTLPSGHPCFDGHFPDTPILPGIAHLALVLEACRQSNWLGDAVLTRLEDIRFSHPIGPDEPCEITLIQRAAPTSVRFEIVCQGMVASKGLLVFA